MILASTTGTRRPGGTPRWRRRVVAVAAAALILGGCGGGPEPELVAFTPSPTPVPTPEPTPTPVPTPTPTAEVLPEVEEKEPAPPMWKVVDTVDNLNMRAEPTTSAEIVATLGPGDSGLIGTGETATADDFDWIEIEPADDRPGGWVASQFLEPDESAAPAAPARVCFNLEDGERTTTAVLDFTADGGGFTGGVRAAEGTDLIYLAVAGRRVDGSVFRVTVGPADGGDGQDEEWTSGAEGIVLGDGTAAAAIPCDDIAGLVDSVDLNVTSYPDPPAG